MPELPEVETIRRDLEPLILNKTLDQIEIKEQVHLLKNCTSQELRRAVEGKKLSEIGRRAKFLLFHFGNRIIILHLRMSGRLLTEPANHSRMIMRFSEAQDIYFDDSRRFGMLFLVAEEKLEELPSIKHLGIEPLSQEYRLESFLPILETQREIKQVLLDQTKIAGLGNIYVCEALFRAGIHPAQRSNSIDAQSAKKLFEVVPQVLNHAIVARGTTFNSYRTPAGELGNFQSDFKVYQRTGLPCSACQTSIDRLVHGGRSSFYCPSCQPLTS